jgi:calcium-dependent protein kinase
VAEAFDRLDGDESGYISTRDLRDFLGKDATRERINELINDADMDHDGQSKSFPCRRKLICTYPVD